MKKDPEEKQKIRLSNQLGQQKSFSGKHTELDMLYQKKLFAAVIGLLYFFTGEKINYETNVLTRRILDEEKNCRPISNGNDTSEFKFVGGIR